ncbi:MAG: threonine synthase, partial [Clostridia bacterium]
MKLISTRNSDNEQSASFAIENGIAKDKGLFSPVDLKVFTKEEIEGFVDLDYQQLATKILVELLDDFTEEEVKSCVYSAYTKEKFDGDIAPVKELGEKLYCLELWHGKTFAFKDIALSILPYLLTISMKKQKQDKTALILVATSGDTGKAALEGFKDVENTKILVFYPQEGVSDIQKLQMQTQEGDNVFVCGINGNFDDAQTAVKQIFTDENIKEKIKKENYFFSSANSINYGRLAPQIVYYFSSYLDLLKNGKIKSGEKINFVVPTGNFGDILAGYYAKKMGLPINKLICASNKNNVLTDFILNG